MSSEMLFAKNLALFQEKFPAIAEMVLAIDDPVSKTVCDQGAIIDIDFGSSRVYRGDARDVSLAQVDSFVEKPRRIGYKAPEGVHLDSPTAAEFFRRFGEKLEQRGIGTIPLEPVFGAGYLMVFGLGLGYHLIHLVEQIEADHLIVVEPIHEFIGHSLHAIDWTELLRRCDERGITLHLVADAKPEEVQQKVAEIIATQGALYLDGAYVYRHYPSWVLDTALGDLVHGFPLQMIARGYYEDERKMIRNAVSNLCKVDHYLLTGTYRTRYPVPVFLVASGPSVDDAMEYVKKWRDHAIVVSGGSSLQVCLKHGVIPDYHVELENVTAVYDMLEHILEKHVDLFPDGKFTGIKFVTSVTVNPRVPPFFDENYFFFRDSVSSSKCFARGSALMTAVGPTITNTMMACFARLGFGDFYLFGFDCGWRDETNHHSKDTAYYTSDTFKKERMVGDVTFPGNFGGTIQSDQIFSWTQGMLEAKIAGMRLNVFNCSDGALLRGAKSLLAESMHFDGPPLDRESVAKRLRDESVFFAKGEYLQQFSLDDFRVNILRFGAEIFALLDKAKAECETFKDFNDRLTTFITEAEAEDSEFAGVPHFVSGTTRAMAKIGLFFLNRVENAQTRRELLGDLIDGVRLAHEDMVEEAAQIFTEARDMIDGKGEPIWASGVPLQPGTTW